MKTVILKVQVPADAKILNVNTAYTIPNKNGYLGGLVTTFTEIHLPTDEEIIEASRWAAYTETPTGNYFDATSGSDYIAGAMWIKSKVMQP